MDYPATQMFVDDEEEEEDEAKEDEDGRTPLRLDKKVKFATLVVDSVAHPVYRGKDFVNKVGRIDSCTIVIDHNTISKEHAEIEAGTGPKSTFISDLGSMNKTKLNDVILRPGRLYQLRDSDNIRFGSVQAVFKLDENSAENDLAQSRLSSEFVVPDTPALVPKTSRQVIPGTPDLSLDRSSLGMSRSSDVSIVAGTQEAGDPSGRSSPRFSRRASSRGPTPGSENKANTSKTSLHDISDSETQNNLSLEDSDEENIFDMLTQQSDVHDEEAQRLSMGKIHVVKPARFAADGIDVDERHSPSIEDLETQKFSNKDKIEPQSYSINDVETQKFAVGSTVSGPCSINDLETQKFTVKETGPNSCSINDLETQKIPAVGKQARFTSINDLETQKFPADNVNSINDLETQKFGGPSKNAEDSETDEEGMFEDSAGSDGIDMFDAPTQLIRPPRSPKETDNAAVATVAEEMTQRHVSKPQEIQEGIAKRKIEALAEVKTCTKQLSVERNEEKKATLNDSIESKLNNMFDDVNESRIEEPTQMLTQHLETILDSTQVSTARSNRDGAEDADTENVQPASDDDIADSDHETTSKPAERVVRVPRILSTPELFADLPAVDIFCRSAGSDRERTETPSPLSVVDKPARSRKSKTSEQGSSGATKTKIDKIDENQSALSNGVESKRSERMEDSESRSAVIESKNSTPRRSTARGKSKARKDVSAGTSTAGRFEESEPAVEDEPMQEQIGKELPPKKRGRLAPSNPPTSKKIVAIVTPTTRAGTKSNANVPVEIWKRSSRSSTVDRPKVVDDEKPTSTAEPPSKRGKRDTKSKKNDSSTSSSGNSTLQTETEEPRAMSAPRTPSRRIQKKRLEKSAVVSDEETTPVKKARTSKTALPQTVTDRRDKHSPSTRTRRARPAASTSAIDDGKSLTRVESSENRPQSSLESQEIQEILGIVDKDDHESIQTLERMPSFRREMRIFRSQVTGNDRRKDEDFREFPKTDKSKETAEDGFEKPAEKTEARKHPVRRTQANQKNDDDEKKVAPPKNDPVVLEVAKPRGRPARTSKIAKEEKAEKKVEDPPPPVSVQQESTPKKRVAVVVCNVRRRQKSMDHGEKENVILEPAPKRGRRKTVEPKKQEKPNADKESKLSPSSSSPLRRGRSSLATPSSSVASLPRTKQRILFTGLNDAEHLISIVNSLGGTITEKPNDCTALVADKIRRTYKFLCGMAMAVPIVSVEWLTESERLGHFLNTGDFLLKDPTAEAKFKFNLRQSLTRATGGKLLEGFTIVLTPNTAPPPTAELKGMIQACGGKVLARPPTKWPEKSVIISRQEDAKNAKKYLAKAPKSVHLLSVEFILTGILRHEVNFEEHKLEI